MISMMSEIFDMFDTIAEELDVQRAKIIGESDLPFVCSPSLAIEGNVQQFFETLATTNYNHKHPFLVVLHCDTGERV